MLLSALSVEPGCAEPTVTDQDTLFGGSAGRTIFYFVSPSAALTLLPASLLFAVIMALSTALSFALKLPLPVTLLLSTLAMSPLVGRLTMAAKEGDLKAGVLSPVPPGAVKGFAIRYAVLNAIWEVPVSLLGAWLLGSVLPAMALRSPPSLGSAPAPMTAVGVLLLLIFAAAASVAAHLVAARASTLAECFTEEPWSWLRSRRRDMPVFLAAAVGGSMVFLALALPPFLVLGALLFRASPGFGTGIMGLGSLLCWSSIPVFTCRLAGAFVSHPAAGAAPAVAAQVTAPAPVDSVASAPTNGAEDVQHALTKLTERAASDLPGAIAEAEALKARAPGNPLVLSQLTQLYVLASRIPDGLSCGAETLSRALSEGNGGLAAQVFAQLSEHKKALQLQPNDWDELARALLTKLNFADAAWCFVKAGSVGADRIRWLKGLVSVADAAAKAGQVAVANTVYQHVIKTAPETPSAEYCRAALERLKPRLKAKPSA